MEEFRKKDLICGLAGYFYGMNHSSRLLQEAVEAFSTLPGIGRKTALRLALHLLKQDAEQVDHLGDAADLALDAAQPLGVVLLVRRIPVRTLMFSHDPASPSSDRSRPAGW